MNWLKSLTKPVLTLIALIIAGFVAARVRNHERKAEKQDRASTKAIQVYEETGAGISEAAEHAYKAIEHARKAEQIKKKAREKAQQKAESITARAVAERLNSL